MARDHRVLLRSILVVWAITLIYISTNLLNQNFAGRSGELLNAGSAPHQQCADGVCTCADGYAGDHCEEPLCEEGCSHGVCTSPDYCHCEDGWKGKTCDVPVCLKFCGHGACTQPYFCKCEEHWYGAQCSQRCDHGSFVARGQQCVCEAGWKGPSCSEVSCTEPACVNGICQPDHTCLCVTGYSGADCSISTLDDKLGQLWQDLAIQFPDLPSPVLYLPKGEASDELWRAVHEWTADMDAEFHVGRRGLFEALPHEDPLNGTRFRTCAAVGNSGSLRGSGMGAIINSHEAVMRFNNAPTKGFERDVGHKVTFEMLNRNAVELWVDVIDRLSEHDIQHKTAHAKPLPKRLLWRAESFHYYRDLRRRAGFDNPEIVHPVLLVRAAKLFGTIIDRLKALNAGVMVEQRAPMGFVGIALLLQICDSVTVLGFDAPVPPQRISYHYFEEVPTPDALSGEVEFLALQMLQRHSLIRLCTVDQLPHCAKILPEAIQLANAVEHPGDSQYRDVGMHGEYQALTPKALASMARIAAAERLAAAKELSQDIAHSHAHIRSHVHQRRR